MTVAFVLSGGASFGASQAGMLEALFERDIRPDVLIGTSAGAINAAFIASRPATVETARRLQQIWRDLTRGQIFPANPVALGMGFLGLRDHSVPADSLRRLLSRSLEVERLEHAPIELHVVAADVLTGEEVRLSAGPAVDAVLASAAIPGVFPPISWAGRLLMDGGIVNNTPISHAVELGADRIYVLPAIGNEPLETAPRGALAAGFAAMSWALNRRLVEDVTRHAEQADLIVLPSPDHGGVLPTDFSHSGELIYESLVRARAALRRTSRPTLHSRPTSPRAVVTLPRAA